MVWLLMGIFILFLLLRVPIAFSLAMSSLIVLALQGFNLVTVIESVFSGMNNSSLIAIPGFVLTGVIMIKGGISRYLLNFLKAWIGHLTGGIAVVTIVACMIFAAISGSSVATVAAIGAIMIPALVESGYDKNYAMGLVATAGTLGILIPPSISFIIFGTVTNTSVGDLFIAGVLPGLFFGFTLIVTAVVYARRKGYGKLPSTPWNERFKEGYKAIWGLLLPVLIFYLIYGGIATPTESSVIASLYALLISVFVYREIKWKDIRSILRETVQTTSMVYMIVVAASIFGMFLTINQVPQDVAMWISDSDANFWTFMLTVNLFLFILGAFLEGVSIILITVPILLPILNLMGINLYYFAVVLVVNLELAMITPPVGLNLFVTSGIAKEPLERVIKSVIPFIFIMLFVLAVVIVWQDLSLYLIPHRQ
ncbi:TRAP transporter large permease [Pseudogracilibacillus sp. SE30717A]|uniref:TRAP transporter large permease n=1 Tax=Pseudogracilibacillus sp. SE30717A TaxID=3098293 RepID=UPI00300E44F9